MLQIFMTMVEHEEVLKTFSLFEKMQVVTASVQVMGNASYA